MEIILLLGAAPYRLDAADAAWFELEIRRSCADESGRVFSLDEAVWSCVLLANTLADDLDAGHSPEPIELGRQHVEGLLTFVLDDEKARRSADIAALYNALRRFRGR